MYVLIYEVFLISAEFSQRKTASLSSGDSVDVTVASTRFHLICDLFQTNVPITETEPSASQHFVNFEHLRSLAGKMAQRETALKAFWLKGRVPFRYD